MGGKTMKSSWRVLAGAAFTVVILSQAAQAQLAVPPVDKLLSAAKSSVGVVGPGGEVIVFYKDGRDVVVRNCGGNYTAVNRLSDCVTVGKENRVPADRFRRSLGGLFHITNADKLNPLTREEIEKFRTAVPGYDKIVEARKQALDAKLARIKKFIEMYGGDEKSQADARDTEKLLTAVRQELTTAKAGAKAIGKVKKIIDDVVDKISSSKFTFVSSNKSSDTAMYTLLKNQYDGSREECGTDEILNGTSPGKPEDGSGKAGRAARLYNVFVTDAFAAAITDAQRIKDCSVIKEKACITEEARRASAGISGKSFGLPTIQEYRDAESNGIREVLPNIYRYLFWTASLVPYASGFAYGFDGRFGSSSGSDRRDYVEYPVRCVGR
ncbi:MAG: hypothetical protein A2583_05060 [Bdellovibrionales bacterium RIFOXYD1_FULL_53_11]|nr:MAG: hypothetical protein A2583_05060 [Bdellovibrionales bacterium RIFOXYD1_FULL_53_11]